MFFNQSSKQCLQQDGFITRLVLVILGGIFLCVWALKVFVFPPSDFPQKTTFTIRPGESLSEVAYRLEEIKIISSAEAFKIMMIALGSEKDISEGEYYFSVPITSIEVALKISGQEFGILQNKITFPEGFTNKEIAERLAGTFDGFDVSEFINLAKDEQGYLFPDTYSFSPQVDPQTVITVAKKNFSEKIESMAPLFSESPYTQKEIITMASLIEKEANNGEEARIVSGILWKRIELGIPLQVDAPFLFLLGKTSAQLTTKDLAIDSPYNTYKYKGLPPTPINNPGSAAIKAALQPVDSPYLYYLHDNEGKIHYGRTYQEHLANKKKYLQ